MKLYQSLFLNIVSIACYIDLFVVTNLLLYKQIDEIFNALIPLKNLCDMFTYNNIVIPLYLLLFLVELILVRTNKIQPILKITNRFYIIVFYINLCISLFSAIIYFYAIYVLNK